MRKILIINSGGTFNKVYNELNGELEVQKNNDAIEEIVKIAFRNNIDITIKGVLHKDSLDLTHEDREVISNLIENYEKVLIVHGTDTMDITASYLSKKHLTGKTVVLTGAMKPFSIEPIEATSNLCISLHFLKECNEHDIFIGMHGLVKKYNKINKNRLLGKFELN